MRFLLLLILLVSCYTPNKAIKQITRASVTYPEKTKAFIRTLYPIKEVKADTLSLYKKGKIDTISNDQYVFVDCPDIPKLKGVSTIRTLVKAPCKCPDTRVDTIYTTITKTVKDTAEVKEHKSFSWAWAIGGFICFAISAISILRRPKKQSITIK